MSTKIVQEQKKRTLEREGKFPALDAAYLGETSVTNEVLFTCCLSLAHLPQTK